jgi:hypothetical protein
VNQNPPIKEAAKVFLDVSQVLQYGDDAVNLAAQRFIETGAVDVNVDIEHERVGLDLDGLVLGR